MSKLWKTYKEVAKIKKECNKIYARFKKLRKECWPKDNDCRKTVDQHLARAKKKCDKMIAKTKSLNEMKELLTERASRSQVKAHVILVIHTVLKIPKAKIKESSRLFDDLGFDDLDLVEVVMALEESSRDQYGMLAVEVPDSMSEKWETVKDIIDGLMSLLYTPSKKPIYSIMRKVKSMKKGKRK